jgi:hypothetical protein
MQWQSPLKIAANLAPHARHSVTAAPTRATASGGLAGSRIALGCCLYQLPRSPHGYNHAHLD